MTDENEQSIQSRGSVANSQANLDGWIPVAERLPNVVRSEYGSVECIVACSTGLVTAMRYTENRNAKTEKGRRPRWEWNWRVATREVTHWMPLPSPPTDCN
jgi:hypothetical protein